MDELGAEVWAKSPRPGEPSGETLTAHTAAVLTRLAAWRDRYPDLERHSGRTDLWNLAGWACLLHDVGKIAPGFQRMLRGGPAFGERHEVLSLVLVGRLPLGEDARGLLAAAVATHHRNLSEILDVLYPFDMPEGRQRLLSEFDEHGEARLRAWLAGSGSRILEGLGLAPLPAAQPLAKAEALAVSMRALAALRERVEPQPATAGEALAARLVRGLVLLADHAGSAHRHLAQAAVLDKVATLRTRIEDGLRAKGRPPVLWRHQDACGAATGHAVLRAPTGSGKTEAALLWAARQRETGPGRPPVFYVLPYRASLNAMRFRITSRYGIPEGAVVLQHSSATAAIYGHCLAEKGYSGQAALWTARAEAALARLMTAPVRVLTPYQLLRAFFGLPGHDAVITDASGGIFILDELHAYDLPRLALIVAAAEHLARDLGARFLVMSATLPAILDREWRRTLAVDPTEIVADSETLEEFRRHRVHVVAADLTSQGILQQIVERHRSGEAVLVVATTVSRAILIYDAVRRQLDAADVSLLHGRFTGEDRARKETELGRRMGTGNRGPNRGCVLVATQVVEVSLDVDFDVLFSDPAPVESLLQRFGRVNRDRTHPSRDVVVCSAIPSDGVAIYPIQTVHRALAIVGEASGKLVDEAEVQAWVDRSYAPVEARWTAELRKLVTDRREAVIRRNLPLESCDALAEAFDRLFDGTEVVPAPLEARYRQLLREEPLRAPALRVPVSVGQAAQLRTSGRLRRVTEGRLSFDVVDLPYDRDRGLDLRIRDVDA
jgi:CRISPR-associated endonuclease/helicase Cas3